MNIKFLLGSILIVFAANAYPQSEDENLKNIGITKIDTQNSLQKLDRKPVI